MHMENRLQSSCYNCAKNDFRQYFFKNDYLWLLGLLRAIGSGIFYISRYNYPLFKTGNIQKPLCFIFYFPERFLL